MLKYNEREIKDIIKQIINDRYVTIKPIGNHHLNRHLVYKVAANNNYYVFKMFYKKNRWNREIACLKNLSKHGVKTNKLLDYGVLRDGTEWILTEYKKGLNFHNNRTIIDYKSKLRLYQQMGDELGKIHSISDLTSFRSFDKALEKYDKYSYYLENNINLMMEEIACTSEVNNELQLKAIDKLKSNTSLFRENIDPRLCHNDYGERNIIINKHINWNLVSVIDFEQSSPAYFYKELAFVSYQLLKEGKDFYNAFKKGYERYQFIDEEKLNNIRNFYMLYTGVGLCHWSYNHSQSYYNKGVRLIEEFIDVV